MDLIVNRENSRYADGKKLNNLFRDYLTVILKFCTQCKILEFDL